MKKRAVLGNSILLSFSVLLAACGNMNTVIAQGGSYSVEASVGSRNLDDGAAIGESDSILISFSSAVEDDPDVTGIRISLETPEGEKAASDVVYRLSADGDQGEEGEESILVGSLSGRLPAFDLPDDLEVGRYVLVMRVLGVDGVLFERRRSIYYLADAELSLTRIVSYPPGAGTSDFPFFPTKVKLLLHADIEADDRLDPYVAWYFGTKIVGKGRLTDGANRILWETPTREGFNKVRVEVYPETPLDTENPDLIGDSEEITITTSKTAQPLGLSGAISNYVRLYRLLGDLKDSTNTADTARAFVRTNNAEPVWVPIEDSYGLSVGASEEYRLNRPLVPVVDGNIEACRILTRAAVSGEGRLWVASFDSGGSDDLQAALYAVTGGLEVRLSGDGKNAKAFVALSAGVAQDEAVLVTVTFSVVDSQAEAKIFVTVDKKEGTEEEAGIAFSSSLSTTGYVRLGGSDGSSSIVTTTGGSTGTTRTAVIDELGVVVVSAVQAKQIDTVNLEIE